jgi:hypothetical protein
MSVRVFDNKPKTACYADCTLCGVEVEFQPCDIRDLTPNSDYSYTPGVKCPNCKEHIHLSSAQQKPVVVKTPKTLSPAIEPKNTTAPDTVGDLRPRVKLLELRFKTLEALLGKKIDPADLD